MKLSRQLPQAITPRPATAAPVGEPVGGHFVQLGAQCIEDFTRLLDDARVASHLAGIVIGDGYAFQPFLEVELPFPDQLS